MRKILYKECEGPQILQSVTIITRKIEPAGHSFSLLIQSRKNKDQPDQPQKPEVQENPQTPTKIDKFSKLKKNFEKMNFYQILGFEDHLEMTEDLVK